MKPVKPINCSVDVAMLRQISLLAVLSSPDRCTRIEYEKKTHIGPAYCECMHISVKAEPQLPLK